MAKAQIKMNASGARAILTSGAVQAFLKAKADRIAAAAGSGMVAHSNPGSSRARAAVVTSTKKAMRAEATDRALTRALDAGRG